MEHTRVVMSGILFVSACSGVHAGTTATGVHGMRHGGRLVERVVEGRSLGHNLLDETQDRRVLIYLPPGYDKNRHRRYPVVYLLSGMGGDHRNFTSDGTPNRLGVMRSPQVHVGLDMKATADALIASGEIPEAILVGVSGVNSYANHWFACSTVIGDYRSWVATDITQFIDHHYRTARDRNHRAILGHSSGGFGALSLAIEYEQTFGAVGVLSPAANDFEATLPGAALPRLIDLFFLANPASVGPPIATPVDGPIRPADFAALWGTTPGGGNFTTNVIYSLAAAFSPNPKKPPFFVDFPFTYPGKVIDPTVFNRWIDEDLVSQIDAAPGNLARTPVYLGRGLGPTVLHPEVGDIPWLRDALIAHGVVHTFDEVPGDHFTAMPQELRHALVFLLNNLGSQDDAPLTINNALREKHRECRRGRAVRAIH
jgi:S-formylglutathione hydrolase FrmB